MADFGCSNTPTEFKELWQTLLPLFKTLGRVRTDECTFVFVPRQTAINGKGGDCYSLGSSGATWNTPSIYPMI